MRLQHFQKRLVPPARRLPIVPSVTRGRRVNPRLERAYEADVPVPRSLVKDEKPFRRRGRHYEALCRTPPITNGSLRISRAISPGVFLRAASRVARKGAVRPMLRGPDP